MDFDYLLLGGGLQNGLFALALLHYQPRVKLALVERDKRLGGNHTWCFFQSDIPTAALAWLTPVIAYHWNSYEVRFPGFNRILPQPYSCITAARFDAVITKQLNRSKNCLLLTGVEVKQMNDHSAYLADQQCLHAKIVLDARGPDHSLLINGTGYQKFLGLEVKLAHSSGLFHPIIMDATFPQQDGYHFLYVMPFSSDHLLIEDTYFSNTPDLDRALIRHDIMAYLQMHNWSMTTILREESGILPMPWHWPYTDQSLKGPIVAGYNGGWFHPATGFSFPVAVRLTQTIARLHSLKLYDHPALHALWTSHHKQARFARLLNWMLFNVIRSEERWRLFKKFYQLPEKTIERFYALQITRSDHARILLGQLPRGLRWPHF